MNEVTFETDRGDPAVGRLETVQRSLDNFRKALDRMALSIETDPPNNFDQAAVMKLVNDIGRSSVQVVQLEGKLSDAERAENGGGGIDTHAAQREVECRLRRLLEHAETERVSGESE